MLRGAEKIIAACEKHLGIKKGHTTADGLFTIQEVECLGACVNAPMMQVNGEWVYEDLTPENTVQLLERLKEGKEVKGPQIDRNLSEGPHGRTSLKVVNGLRFRILSRRANTTGISRRLRRTGKRQRLSASQKRSAKLNRQRNLRRKRERHRPRRCDIAININNNTYQSVFSRFPTGVYISARLTGFTLFVKSFITSLCLFSGFCISGITSQISRDSS